MSSVPKNGFARKTGATLLGVTLFGSLMLTACAPASQTNDSAPNPTAVSVSEAPKGLTKFNSAAFDLDKQVSVEVKKHDENMFLGKGVLSGNFPSDSTQHISFTAYEDKDASWKYELKEPPLGSASSHLMRWKDKSYVVVKGWVKKSTPASGLQAAKTTSYQAAIILDADTGKEVNTYKSVEFEGGGTAPDSTYFVETPAKGPLATSGRDFTDYIHMTIPTGLIFHNGEGHRKLVDPLTGAELAVYDKQRAPKTLLNNESGFYEYAYSAYLNTEGVPMAKATFGNFALVVTSLPETRANSGVYVQSSKYELVNTLTKKTVSETVCRNGMNLLDSETVSYSPNFRYVSFGNVAFDTESSTAFCSTPLDESVRKLIIHAVDNEGNMYATADGQYLKVDIADTTKVETLVEDLSADGGKLPIRITEKGSAVFYSDNSDDVLAVIPAK